MWSITTASLGAEIVLQIPFHGDETGGDGNAAVRGGRVGPRLPAIEEKKRGEEGWIMTACVVAEIRTNVALCNPSPRPGAVAAPRSPRTVAGRAATTGRVWRRGSDGDRQKFRPGGLSSTSLGVWARAAGRRSIY